MVRVFPIFGRSRFGTLEDALNTGSTISTILVLFKRFNEMLKWGIHEIKIFHKNRNGPILKKINKKIKLKSNQFGFIKFIGKI